jgi:UDP-GlcNAc:undecaprenyl-phosphate/decaprenyl-phosphate GlcNAc-1-phosphate transferase
MVVSIIICSFFLTILSGLYCQKLFIKNEIFDTINIRSSHSSVATRSGGLSIFVVLSVMSIFFYLNGIELYDFSIIVPLSILFLVGVYDDVYDVNFKLKFIFQIIAAKIIIDNGFIIDNLNGFMGLYEINRIIAQLLTIFIIVSIINAINLIDGIDGLAISITLLFIICYEFFAIITSDFIFLNVIIISSIVPLYYFNFRRENKIFLGDSGSYLLGGIISIYVLNVLSSNYIIKPEYDINKILFIISILIYPIIDVIRIFIVRVYKNKSPYKADKNHIHHIILRKTNNHFQTSLILILSSLFFIIFIHLL